MMLQGLEIILIDTAILGEKTIQLSTSNLID